MFFSLEGLVDAFETEVYELFHPFGGALSASYTGLFGATSETDEAVPEFARVAFDGEFRVPTAEYNAAAVV